MVYIFKVCRSDGIGRHAGFRFLCREACGFKSHLLHFGYRATGGYVGKPQGSVMIDLMSTAWAAVLIGMLRRFFAVENSL